MRLRSQAIRVYKYTKIKGLDSREITSLPEIKEVIYKARHLNHRWKKPARSSQDHLRAMKVYYNRLSHFH